MPILKLGSRPKSFDKVVTFTDIDGSEMQIPVIYKYRTLPEFGTLVDEYQKQGEDKIAAEQAKREAERKAAEERGEIYVPPPFTNNDLRQEQAQATADYLMQILDGWKLDVPFDAEAVLQLCCETPAAATQIINDYRGAIVEGRLGNSAQPSQLATSGRA